MSAGAWWVIHESDLLAMMERTYAGEDPGLVLTEQYANIDHRECEGCDGSDE